MKEYQDRTEEAWGEISANFAYYEGKKQGFSAANSIVLARKNKAEKELKKIRSKYLAELQNEEAFNCIEEEDKYFLRGRIDGVDVIINILKEK